jgi:galactokinase
VAAVPRGFVIAAAPREDDVVVARDAKWETAVSVPVTPDRRALGGWVNYVAVVVRRLARDFRGAVLGADLVFESDLPRAAGVSSSSALVVAVATALARRASLEGRSEWRESIASDLDLANYLGAVENGRAFGTFAGSPGGGTHGGSEDHTAILAARAGAVRAFAYVPVRPGGEASVPAHWRFLVLSSGVHAAKAGGVRARYNAASLATQAVVDVCCRQSGRAVPVSLAALVAAEGAEAVGEALQRQAHPDFSPVDLDRRLAHFLREDARVRPALDAFGQADAAALGDLAAASQDDARELLGNQTPETSALVALAREAGAFAASSFGAGFGGSAWALAPTEAADEVLDRWRRRYVEAWPARADAAGFAAAPAPPCTEIRLDGAPC